MRFVYFTLFSLIIGFLSFFTYQIGYERFEQSSLSASKERLSLYQASLRSTLERASHLPQVVTVHPHVGAALSLGRVGLSFNTYLKTINEAAQSDVLFVMDPNGKTIASSNFDLSESFVGKNYGFRPYFKDAMRGEQGRFFAIGATTGRPGYFISEPILEGNTPIGVAVVKIEFDELLADWVNAGEDVFITDADGVIVLTSNNARIYKTIGGLSQVRIAELSQSRKFAGRSIEKLGFTSETEKFEGRISLNGDPFYVSSVNLPTLNWKLHYLTPLGGVSSSAIVLATIVFLLFGLSLLAVLYIRSRIKQERLELVAVEAERVKEANIRLEREVKTRRDTEKKLRDTQAELIQSSRLAALGKMSAAIVHEVNQPVSAIRTFTSSGSLLLKKKRLDDANDVFTQIKKMTERLGTITSDLLVFSRKPVSVPKRVNLHDVIDTIALQYKAELKASKIKLDMRLIKADVYVMGSHVRFEQLFSNLIKNAIQACENVHKPRITINTQTTDKTVFIGFVDNGDGVPQEIMDQLFDPFFTTKGVGKGVGLGLALCYAIADEAGGSIKCENHVDGGACFVVELPKTNAASTVAGLEHVDA